MREPRVVVDLEPMGQAAGGAKMRIGEQVEVHVRYTDTWAAGFEVADVVEGGCRLRRRSDGALLPVVTSEEDCRPLAAPPG